MTREHAPNRHRGNSADALSWWGRVTIAAGSVTLSVAKAWEKKARATAAQSVQFLQLCRIRRGLTSFISPAQGVRGDKEDRQRLLRRKRWTKLRIQAEC